MNTVDGRQWMTLIRLYRQPNTMRRLVRGNTNAVDVDYNGRHVRSDRVADRKRLVTRARLVIIHWLCTRNLFLPFYAYYLFYRQL